MARVLTAVFVLPVLVAGAIATAQFAHAQEASKLRIATWNMAWLSDLMPSNGQRPKHTHQSATADIALARRYIDRMRADVVAFHELDGVSTGARIFDTRIYELHTTSGPGIRQPGFAIRKGLRFVRNADVAGLGLNPNQQPLLQRAADITVHLAERKIRMLAIRLKLGCDVQELYNGGDSCNLLRRQSAAIAGWIMTRIQTDTAFVILGDFGRELGDRDQVWQIINVGGSAKLLKLTTAHPGPCLRLPEKPSTEYIVLGGAARNWMARHDLKVILDSETRPENLMKIGDRCTRILDLAVK